MVYIMIELHVHGQTVISFVQLLVFDKQNIKILKGKNLRRLRIEKKLTQDQLGEMLDPQADGSHIASIEGGRGMSDETLAKFCAAMKVDVWQFFLTEETPIVSNEEEHQALKRRRQAKALNVAEDVEKYETFRIEDAKKSSQPAEKKFTLEDKIEQLAEIRGRDRKKKSA